MNINIKIMPEYVYWFLFKIGYVKHYIQLVTKVIIEKLPNEN